MFMNLCGIVLRIYKKVLSDVLEGIEISRCGYGLIK